MGILRLPQHVGVLCEVVLNGDSLDRFDHRLVAVSLQVADARSFPSSVSSIVVTIISPISMVSSSVSLQWLTMNDGIAVGVAGVRSEGGGELVGFGDDDFSALA